MEAFSEYLDTLDSLLATLISTKHNSVLSNSIDAALDGQPARELRRLVPIDDLRASGAFFTGSKLSKIALGNLLNTIDNSSVILDPACGAGDLLIACTNKLPKGRDVERTLALWNTRLIGRDLHSEFIQATKSRLTLAAFRSDKKQTTSSLDTSGLLPNIKQECGLSNDKLYKLATHIVTNPPFTMVTAPKDCSWAQGTINYAAIFMEKIITCCRTNTHVVAILPDVLRSGSRYKKWRQLVERTAEIKNVRLFGQFDNSADVDVFILELTTNTHSAQKVNPWELPLDSSRHQVSDFFKLCVGPVVDYRDPHVGNFHPFLKAKDLPHWQTIEKIDSRRKYSKRLINPPFVVIRRTSRPGDKYRAIGTIVSGNRPVAIENHLIVLEPLDGRENTCRSLLENFQNSKTNDWLNKRIRCRHLTISSIAELPWWED